MTDINRMFLAGRLGADPTLRETKTGIKVANFSLATGRRKRGEENAMETQWHRVVAWDKQAEFCAQYLKKGTGVFVEGALRSHEYTAKDGEVRVAFEVHADRVNFLPKGRSKEASASDADGVADHHASG